MDVQDRLPLPTLRRMPGYLRKVTLALQEGQEYISTSLLSRSLHITSIQVRKDLEYLNVKGWPKKGYLCRDLEEALGNLLGLDSRFEVILVGLGAIGRALMEYPKFKYYGISIKAAFDSKIRKSHINGIPVYPMSNLKKYVKENPMEVAVLAVNDDLAQSCLDQLVEVGIKGVWNFTTKALQSQKVIWIKNIDLGFLFGSFIAEYLHHKKTLPS
ncbi:redox-sensing transcriptional repressor Rex [Spirochaeta cellobiosiphila]|uniref:redox-sensing transcriptional repressor Rex n=1 Tax=Spirochaeta cellobiosiphila TaxID=504483 RepID=UPI000428656A|nr:redox-sensing transcriptional repressor Rex [Spirochaeta cellobiosiphila]